MPKKRHPVKPYSEGWRTHLTREENRLVTLVHFLAWLVGLAPMATALALFPRAYPLVSDWARRVVSSGRVPDSVYLFPGWPMDSNLRAALALVIFVDGAVVGFALGVTTLFVTWNRIPALRSIDTASGEMDASSRRTVTKAVIACAAVTLLAFGLLLYSGGTYVSASRTGITQVNRFKGVEKRYSWDKVLCVDWEVHVHYTRHRRHRVTYYCVHMVDDERICLGPYRDIAVYASRQSRMPIIKALEPCPYCGNEKRYRVDKADG